MPRLHEIKAIVCIIKTIYADFLEYHNKNQVLGHYQTFRKDVTLFISP